MIAKTVTIKNIKDKDSDLQYWLSQSPEARLNAVGFLMKQYHAEYPERLQRVYRIIKLK